MVGREGTNYDTVSVVAGASDLEYGIGGWSLKGGSLLKLLDAYAKHPNAQFASQIKGLVSTGTASSSPELVSVLKQAGADPVMRQTQDDQFRTDVIEPSVSVVSGLGLHLPLSIAVFCDSTLHICLNNTKKLADKATEKTGAAPATGGDEKAWTFNFMDARTAYYKTLPIYNRFASAFDRRVDVFRRLAMDGDWMLTTTAAETGANPAPN